MNTRRSTRIPVGQTKSASKKTTRSARPTAGRLLVRSMAAEAATEVSPLPSLRSGLLLYLLVLVASTVIIVGLETKIELTLLRFLAALFVFVGFTAVAMLLTRTRIRVLVGQRPGLLMIIISLLAGIALWVPGNWFLNLLDTWLTSSVGLLPPVAGSNAPVISQALVLFVIIPACEGLLFFGFLLASARGLGNRLAVLMTAVLFAIFGLFSTGYGVSDIPNYFLLGLVGAVLTLQSGSVIPGILMLGGNWLGGLLIPKLLAQTLLGGAFTDPFSFNWLLAAALFGFIAFALTRIGRAFSPARELPMPAKPGALWWLLMIAILMLTGTLIYGEITARAINGPQQTSSAPYTPPVTGNTAPPVPAATAISRPGG